ncbi:hypothetical protein NDU88_000216 [Pleurodeles waltl]|uniref:Basic proline-rich protein-like n=1 Tax=Pleurodeles waltl TaxID=8319 RepID=A0AAV7VU08_PLEWA|nr:hypothetical protein NDU88_000216 [Pleurodeles waltl]
MPLRGTPRPPPPPWHPPSPPSGPPVPGANQRGPQCPKGEQYAAKKTSTAPPGLIRPAISAIRASRQGLTSGGPGQARTSAEPKAQALHCTGRPSATNFRASSLQKPRCPGGLHRLTPRNSTPLRRRDSPCRPWQAPHSKAAPGGAWPDKTAEGPSPASLTVRPTPAGAKKHPRAPAATRGSLHEPDVPLPAGPKPAGPASAIRPRGPSTAGAPTPRGGPVPA